MPHCKSHLDNQRKCKEKMTEEELKQFREQRKEYYKTYHNEFVRELTGCKIPTKKKNKI